MTATYFPTALGTALHEIRLRLGDVGPDFRLQDEEIEAYAPGGALGQTTNLTACLALCDVLIARYAGVVDASEGGASFSGSQLVAGFEALRKRLQAESLAGVSVSGSFFGGRTLEPAFTRISGDPTYDVLDSTDEDYT